MHSVEWSIQELKNQITKLDNLILMGETFIHMVNASFGKCTLDELPPDIQEDYLGILKDIKESLALKKDLGIMLYAAESICNRAAEYENNEEVDENE